MRRSTSSYLVAGSFKLAVLTSALTAALPALAQSHLNRMPIDTDSTDHSEQTTAESHENMTTSVVISNLNNEEILNVLHHANSGEIGMGTEALLHLSNQQVRDFAQLLVNDHSENELLVEQLASDKGIRLFAFEPSTDEVAAAFQLNTLTGSTYDLAFLKIQALDHEEMLQNLTLLKSQTQDADILALLNQTIPVVQKHLDFANSNISDLELIIQGDA